MTKPRLIIFLILIAGILPVQIPSAISAEDKSTAKNSKPYIPVGKARTKKTVFAFPEVVHLGEDKYGAAKKITDTITSDLTFIDLFLILPRSTYLEDPKKAGIRSNEFKFSDWTGIKTEILLKAAAKTDGSTITLETFLYNAQQGKSIFAKRYVANFNEIKTLSHTVANDVVHHLTGLPGIFMTKIAMSCDRTRKKEIYVMNFDGTEVRRVTNHRSIAFAPAWGPQGDRIAYSLYTRHRGNIKNIDLYEFDLKRNTIRPLSRKKGINSGASYSPDGKYVALTMSYLGNPEIFLLDLATRKTQRLTHSYGFDVDPSWHPSGKQLAFVSSRTGKPMVFSMNSSGKSVRRLTYAGRYNATPYWSPQNNKIAFAGWIDGRFDIFIMNPDGTKIERLTKNQGNNEDPTFSPDGNFIAFSSNRTGTKNIYVMNIDGTYVKRLTYGLGNCVTPKWSNP